MIGKTIGSVEQETPRLRVVALKRGPDAISLIPDSATMISAEHHLVVIGERGGLKKLIAMVGA